MTRYEEVEEYGRKMLGKKYLLNYLAGSRLTPMQAIYATCYECMGYFADGGMDCKIEDCPNYPFMRFNPHRRTAKRKAKAETVVEAGVKLKSPEASV